MKQAFVQETNIQLYKMKIEKLQYFEKLYSIKLENLNKINEFLDLPKSKQEEKNNIKRHMTNKMISISFMPINGTSFYSRWTQLEITT